MFSASNEKEIPGTFHKVNQQEWESNPNVTIQGFQNLSVMMISEIDTVLCKSDYLSSIKINFYFHLQL